MAYSFATQKRSGLAHEATLDAFFERWFVVAKMDHDDPSASDARRAARKGMQLMGVDRLFTSRADGARYTVEYKADTRAGETGNAFIETVSVDARRKAGWAYTSCAQILAYYLPTTGRVYVVNLPALRAKLPDWVRRFSPPRKIPNRGYNTLGLTVPLSELEPLSCSILTVPPTP